MRATIVGVEICNCWPGYPYWYEVTGNSLNGYSEVVAPVFGGGLTVRYTVYHTGGVDEIDLLTHKRWLPATWPGAGCGDGTAEPLVDPTSIYFELWLGCAPSPPNPPGSYLWQSGNHAVDDPADALFFNSSSPTGIWGGVGAVTSVPNTLVFDGNCDPDIPTAVNKGWGGQVRWTAVGPGLP
jgi:hypothetical protein